MLVFTPLIFSGHNKHLELGGMSEEKVAHELGAFDYEGAICLPCPFIAEEISNARRLGARQGKGRERHAGVLY